MWLSPSSVLIIPASLDAHASQEVALYLRIARLSFGATIEPSWRQPIAEISNRQRLAKSFRSQDGILRYQ
jgi:hypothetical protein